MQKSTDPIEIATRFGVEINEIQGQINFLKKKSIVWVNEIDELNRTLESNAIEHLPTRQHLGTPSHTLSTSEIVTLVNAFSKIQPLADKKKRQLMNLEDSIPASEETEDSVTVDVHVGAILENDDFTGEESEEDINAYMKGDLNQWEHDIQLNGDHKPVLTVPQRRKVLREAYNAAKAWKLSSRIRELQDFDDRAEEIRTILKNSDPKATMGIFRQGFIAMMAAFDAAIFDLVRLALEINFFKLAVAFDREKISLDQFAECGSFEDFRDQIIEGQLKKKYVRELLHMLKEPWKVDWFQSTKSQDFPRLIEIVHRRNIHLHNRGFVDQRYVESGFNLDGLQNGDLAVIDEKYWKIAKSICHLCVCNVTSWAKSKPITEPERK